MLDVQHALAHLLFLTAHVHQLSCILTQLTTGPPDTVSKTESSSHVMLLALVPRHPSGHKRPHLAAVQVLAGDSPGMPLLSCGCHSRPT